MSHVANVILWTALDENSAIEGVQRWLLDNAAGRLVDVSEHTSPTNRKAVDVSWWAGAFNYLDIPEFLDVVFAQPWENPECVRVIIQDEHDDFPTMYDSPSKPDKSLDVGTKKPSNIP